MTGAATAQEAFDLDALIAAAKAEPPLTVYDSTGKIVDMAEAFAKKYGLQATGSEVKATAQLEMIIREAQAKNVHRDVSILSDAPSVMAQLVLQGFVTSWVPPDLAAKIPAQFHNPLVVVNSANVWAYNTEAFKTCPVTNIWQLAEPEWKGRVAMQDPLGKPAFTDWFSQMATYGNEPMRAAYKDQFGKNLDTDEASASAEWIKGFANSAPLVTDGDDPVRMLLARRGRLLRSPG